MAAGKRVKEEGAANDLLERVAGDALFAAVHGSLDQLLDSSKFVGRAPEQVCVCVCVCVYVCMYLFTLLLTPLPPLPPGD
jgi:adenylosuccinate lyase